MMSNWLLQWGNIFIPAGIAFLVLGIGFDDYRGLASLMVAFVLLLMGITYMVMAKRKLEEEQKDTALNLLTQLRTENSKANEIIGKLDNLVQTVDGLARNINNLINEIRQDRDGRRNNDNRNRNV